MHNEMNGTKGHVLDVGDHVVWIGSQNHENENGHECVGRSIFSAIIGVPQKTYDNGVSSSTLGATHGSDVPKMTLQQLRIQIILSLGAL